MTRGDELTVSHLLEFLHARGHVRRLRHARSPARRTTCGPSTGLAREPLPRGRADPAQGPHAQRPSGSAGLARSAGRSRSACCSAPPSSARWPRPWRPQPLRHGLRLLHPLGRRPCAHVQHRQPAGPRPPSWRCSCRRRSTPSGSPRPRPRRWDRLVLPVREPAAWPRYEARLWQRRHAHRADRAEQDLEAAIARPAAPRA